MNGTWMDPASGPENVEWCLGADKGPEIQSASSFNPTTYTTSPALDEDRLLGWLMGGSFHLSQDLFHSTLLYSIHFHHPSQFVLKVNNFVMFKYRESHAEIRSRRFFFLHLTYVEPKHQSG